MELDLEFIRAQFPAFAQPNLSNQAFFENAGGSYTCGAVINRLMRFYTERKVQPYAPYDASQKAGAEMDEARARMAAILGVDTDELSFGPSTTQNVYVLAQAFGQMLSAGDAIIVTNQDHEANTGPWRRLSERGIIIREWQIDPETGALSLDGLRALIDDKVRLVCFPHCSNFVAQINPVAQITKIARAAGAYTCVDGVSYAPHGFPDVAALGADIYLFSAYKTYGPHQGLMVIRRALGEALPNQGHYFNADTLYKRFTPAGPDHAQVAACAGMADYVDSVYAHHVGGAAPAGQKAQVVHDLMRGHETKLLEPLLAWVQSRNSLRLIGPASAEGRAPTVAISMGQNAEQAAAKLAARGIMAGGGDFYAVRALKAMGIDPEQGVLRLSFTHYTSPQEIDQLIRALDEIL